MAPICPTAQTQLQGQHSRKPEQLCPSLPEGPQVHCEHSQHFLGCCCWINNLGCSRSITEQSSPVTQTQRRRVCLFLWGWTGAGHEAAAEHTASTEEPERTSSLWAWLPHPMVCFQHRNRPGISHPTWERSGSQLSPAHGITDGLRLESHIQPWGCCAHHKST